MAMNNEMRADALREQLTILQSALRQIEEMPFSAVNDADSLRHTIKTMQYLAHAALNKATD